MKDHVAKCCPSCGGVNFHCQQYTWNEQPFEVLADGNLDWGVSSNYDYENEIPIAVVCEDCETDCTELFADQIELYEDPVPKLRRATFTLPGGSR